MKILFGIIIFGVVVYVLYDSGLVTLDDLVTIREKAQEIGSKLKGWLTT